MGSVPVLVMLALLDVASGCTAGIVVGSVVAGTVVVECVVAGLPHITIYSASPLGVFCILKYKNSNIRTALTLVTLTCAFSAQVQLP